MPLAEPKRAFAVSFGVVGRFPAPFVPAFPAESGFGRAATVRAGLFFETPFADVAFFGASADFFAAAVRPTLVADPDRAGFAPALAAAERALFVPCGARLWPFFAAAVFRLDVARVFVVDFAADVPPDLTGDAAPGFRFAFAVVCLPPVDRALVEPAAFGFELVVAIFEATVFRVPEGFFAGPLDCVAPALRVFVTFFIADSLSTLFRSFA